MTLHPALATAIARTSSSRSGQNSPAVLTKPVAPESDVDQQITGGGRALQYQARFDTDLSTGLPDPALLPDLGPSLRRVLQGGSLDGFLAEPIVPELRDHLLTDWPTSAEIITMADGATGALDLIATTFLRHGDRVAAEHSCYRPMLDLL